MQRRPRGARASATSVQVRALPLSQWSRKSVGALSPAVFP